MTMARRDTNGNANGSGSGAGRRSACNSAFARASFLEGGNAAYVEQRQDSDLRDPASLDLSWREFFTQMNDARETIAKTAQGPRWKRYGWPDGAGGELVSALDGNWAESETSIGAKLEAKARVRVLHSLDDPLRTTRDSVRALMMIRAYRIRGHLHANLDPLGIEPPKDHEELHPAT